MTKNVYKYRIHDGIALGSGAVAGLFMPRNARVIHIAFQRDELFAWAIVDPRKRPEYRMFALYVTGQDIDEEDECETWTVTPDNYGFVLHVVDRGSQWK